MRVQPKRSLPHFVSQAEFCRSLGVYHQLATHLLQLRVLEPDGFLGTKPIFKGDLESIDRAKAKVTQFRAQQNRAQQNLRELAHV